MPSTTPTSRIAIRVLPALVVNQIAAGEVVERPASVVKELLDNAIDAGAGRITVELEQGGVELIRVTDDGGGIEPEQLALAVHPHATSKVRDAADLDTIATMGFRGEALASIASVSRLSIRSRVAEEDAAAVIEVEGDQVKPVRPDAGPVGTRVTVRNLFFNTPARRKFLRTAQTERTHCLDIVRSLAMSHPAIGFRVELDGATVLDLAPNQSAKERAFAIIGREHEEQYVEVSADRFDDARGLALWGLAGLPTLAAATTKKQFVFLNGRPIRDKSIIHAVREAYRGLIEPGRHPAVLLMLEMSPGAVDVNVHPAKTEVRFRDQSLVHRVVYRAVQEALRGRDLTPAATFGGGGWRFERTDSVRETAAVEPKPRRVDEFLERLSAQGGTQTGFDYQQLKQAVDEDRLAMEAERQRIAEREQRLREEAERVRAEAQAAALATDHLRSARVRDADGQGALPAVRPADRVLQVHNSFLVTQDEQGLVIIDQHALHERVMFEKLKDRIAMKGALESQRLLMPTIVEATEARVDLLEQSAELFGRLGIEAHAAGPRSVSVQAFPSFLFEKGVEPGPFIEELLEKCEAEGFAVGSEDALHEVLDMMACKAAVKAGDRLSDEELGELLKLRAEIERSSNCPHGRPTAIRLTVGELERQFGRA